MRRSARDRSRGTRERTRRSLATTRALPTLTVAALLVLVAPWAVRAQESGGSFGGSSWDDEPSGGGSDWGSSGGSDWGSSGGSSPQDDYAAREAERRAEEERRAAEERRRQAEEEERRRREEEARRAAERARKLALPPMDRARELPWPATPPRPGPDRTLELTAPLRAVSPPASSWPLPPSALSVDPPPGAVVVAPMEWGAFFCCGAPLFFALAPLAWLVTRTRAPWRSVSDDAATGGASRRVAAAPRGAARALRVSIAFDWTARARLQAELAAMARRHDLRSRPGLHAGAVEIAALLTAHAQAARYVCWDMAPPGDPRAWFQTRANDLRARFRAELVRNAATEAGRVYAAKANEGEGLVVVSVVVASKVAIPAPPAHFDGAALGAAIRAIAQRGSGETLALEVIWSPAAEQDRMSSYELEAHYPELQRTSDGVGRVQCAYCRAPFPAELGRCPACGAPLRS